MLRQPGGGGGERSGGHRQPGVGAGQQRADVAQRAARFRARLRRADDGQFQVGGALQQLLGQGAVEHPRERALAGATDDDRRNAAAASVVDQRVDDAGPVQQFGFAAQPARQREGAVEFALGGFVEVGAGLHADHAPRCIAPFRQPPCHPHQIVGLAAAIDRHQHAPAQRAAGQAPRGLRLAQVAVDAVCSGLHRQFAQRGEVGGREERLQRMRRLVRHVHLALLQALDQLARREVDQLDVAQAVEDEIRHGLADAHAGDAVDHVIEAFQVLDVDRGVDVDAGIQQFHHVLPAALVAAAWHVAMRQFVHQRHRRPACQHRIQVELFEHANRAVRRHVLAADARKHLESFEQRLGFDAAMGFDQANHHVHALFRELARSRQHRVGLADARGRAQEQGQPAAALPLQFAEQGIGLGAAVAVHACSLCGRGAGISAPAHPAPG